MSNLKAIAEKCKRDLLVGKLIDLIGMDKTAAILKECQTPFEQIDFHCDKAIRVLDEAIDQSNS